MSEALFAIFMVSCSHMLGVCRETTEPVELFESHQACQEQLYRSLDQTSARYEDSFPVAIGKCIELAPQMAVAEPDFKWFFKRDGGLVVEAVQPTEVQNAASDIQLALSSEDG